MDQPSRVLTYQRSTGVDAELGNEYEMKLNSLVYIRCQKLFEQQEENRKVKSFSVLNNVDGIGAFDDIVVRVEFEEDGVKRIKLLFIQCKHLQNLANSKIKFNDYLLKDKNVRKFFESFLRIRDILEKNPTKKRKLNFSEEQTKQDLQNLFQCDFQNCEFIFFTNILAEGIISDDLNIKEYKLEENENTDQFDITKHLINSDTGKVLKIDFQNKGFDFLKQRTLSNDDLVAEFSKMFRVFTNQPSQLDLTEEIENYNIEIKDIENVTSKLVEELKLIYKNSSTRQDTASTSSSTDHTKQRKVVTENDNLIEKAVSFNEFNKQCLKVIDRIKDEPIFKNLFFDVSNMQSELKRNSHVEIKTQFPKLEKLKLQQFVTQNKNQFLIFLEKDYEYKNWLLVRETLHYMNIEKVYIHFDAVFNVASVPRKANEIFITIMKSEFETHANPWDQFSEKARKYILNYRIGCGTKEKVKLHDLCGERCGEILDEDSICKILDGKFKIRQNLPETIPCYVPRCLKLMVCSDETIKNLYHEKPKNSQFVVFSDKGRPLTGKDRPKRHIDAIDNAKQHDESKLYFDNFDKAIHCISNLPSRSTYHLCAFEDQGVKLIYTIGEQRFCCESEIIKEDEIFIASKTKVTILCDVAGMGKTTTMKYLAEIYKKNNPSHWVHFIQLNNFVDKLANERTFRDRSTALNFLSSHLLGLTLTGIELKLFIDSCKESGNIALFLDGFDEINPGAEKSFTSLLNNLQKSNIKRIIVSSRPSFVKILEKAFMQNSIKFNKFNTDEKRSFLKSFWKQEMKSREMPVDDTKLSSIVNIAIASFENEEHVLNEILETPLLIRMFAEGYFEHIFQTAQESTNLKFNFSLSNLYEMFINTHVKQYLEKTDMKLNKLPKEARQQLIQANLTGITELSCSIILPKSLQNNTKIVNSTTKRLLRLGLITNENPSVFIHRTIAEYLVAKFMISEILSKQPNRKLTAVSIMSIFMYNKYSVLRKFIVSLLNVDKLPVYFHEIGKYVESERNLQQDSTPIHIAAKEGHVKLIQAFLKRDITLMNQKDIYKRTALHWACLRKKTNVIQYLIKNKDCILNTVDNYNVSVLHVAAQNGILDVMKLILNPAGFAEADSNENPGTLETFNSLDSQPSDAASHINMLNGNAETPLHLAVKNRRIDAVKFLLQNKDCLLNLLDNNNTTVFEIATQDQDVEIMKILLERDRTIINVDNGIKKSPISIAIENSNIEAVKLLLQYNCVVKSISQYSKNSALHIAVSEGNTDIIDALIEHDKSMQNQPNENGCTPLHFAIYNSNIQSFKCLLKHIDRPGVSLDFSSALRIAVTRRYTETIAEIMEKLIQIDESIINSRDDNGKTPLHFTAKCRNVGATKQLLKYPGCAADISDKNSEYPIHKAAKSGCTEIMKMLLQSNRSLVNAKNSRGKTPLFIACFESNYNAINILIHQHECNVNILDNEGNNIFHAACASNKLHRNAYFRDQVLDSSNVEGFIFDDLDSKSALIKYVYSSEKAVDYFDSDDSVNVNNFVADNSNNYQFYESRDEGSQQISQNQIKVLTLLLQHNRTLLNMQNCKGQTPLHIAFSIYNFGLIIFLLTQPDCLTNILDKCGKSILHLACCRFKLKIKYFDKQEQYFRFVPYFENIKSQFFVNIIALLDTLLQRDLSLLNMQTHKGETALHLACSTGNIDAVKFLLSKNCSIRKRDKFGNTAFHHAAANARTKIMELLWQHRKSQINMTNNDGNSALHLIFFNFNKETLPKKILYNQDQMDYKGFESFHKSAEFILHHKYSLINKKNTLGRTPLHIFCASDNTEKIRHILEHNDFLRRHSSYNDPSVKRNANRPGCSREQTVVFNLLLANQLCSVKEQDNFGYTALHYAAFYNQIKAMELLLLRDNSVLHVKSWKGKTALHVAHIAGSRDAAIFLADIDLSLNFRDNICNPVIHYAAWKEQIDGMELLQRLGKIKQDKKTKLIVTCSEGLSVML